MVGYGGKWWDRVRNGLNEWEMVGLMGKWWQMVGYSEKWWDRVGNGGIK